MTFEFSGIYSSEDDAYEARREVEGMRIEDLLYYLDEGKVEIKHQLVVWGRKEMP